MTCCRAGRRQPPTDRSLAARFSSGTWGQEATAEHAKQQPGRRTLLAPCPDLTRQRTNRGVRGGGGGGVREWKGGTRLLASYLIDG